MAKMKVNHKNENVLEAEMLNDGNEVIIVACPKCGDVWQLEDGDVICEPYPCFTCPHCGEWIPLF